MKRILLVIEGFNELAYMETLLKKVGFDCTGTQNELGLSEKILSFRPHAMLATCRGRKVKGETLMERLASKGLQLPRLILLASAEARVTEFEKSHSRAHHVLISPISPGQLIQALASSLEMDSESLMKKLGRDLDPSITKEKLEFYVKGGSGPLEENAPQGPTEFEALKKRSSGAEVDGRGAGGGSKKPKRDPSELLKNLPDTPGGLNRKLVESQTADFRKREQDADIRLIDEERQKFVERLFKTAKGS